MRTEEEIREKIAEERAKAERWHQDALQHSENFSYSSMCQQYESRFQGRMMLLQWVLEGEAMIANPEILEIILQDSPPIREQVKRILDAAEELSKS